MWGFVGANNRGWYGSGVRTARYRNILDPAPEPIVFKPTDISGCALWLDANDSSTIQVNEDTSGVNVNRVMKWFDKAKPDQQNHYEKDNHPYTSGLYNTHYMNQLNTVYFEPNAYMLHHDGGFTFNFQARTFFAVVKPLTDLSDASGVVQPYIGIYNTDTFPGGGVGYMNTGISYDASGFHYSMCENGVSCGVVFDLSNNPLNQRMVLMFAQSDIDLSGNVGSYDTISQPLTASDLADSYATGKSQYILNNPVYGTAQDIAEIIMYGRLLTSNEQTQVLEYLADKWNLSGQGFDYSQTQVEQPLEPEPPKAPLYTYIVYTQFAPDPPNWYWCDENAQVESPPVLAEAYDGTTALRDGLAVVVSGTFYA